jgi:hypothetical protein
MSEVYVIQGHEREVPVHDMIGIWGSGIELHSFLICSLGRDDWSASSEMGVNRELLDAWQKKNFCAYCDVNHNSFISHSAPS